MYGENFKEDITNTTYEYDEDGKLITQTVCSGEETHQVFEEENQQESYVPLVPTINYAYNDVNQLTFIKYGPEDNPDTTREIEYIQNSDDENTGLISSYGIKDYRTYEYEYDDNGNITSESGYYDAGYEYTYDKLNQLKTTDYWMEYDYIHEEYTYDSNGNILKKTEEYTDPDDEEFYYLNTYNYTYDTVWKDRLTTVKKNSTVIRNYTYGTYGQTNPTSDGRFNYTWDGRNMMSATKIDDGTKFTFKYNDSNQRIEKQKLNASGTLQEVSYYYYTGENLTHEIKYSVSGNTKSKLYEFKYIYDAGGIAYILHRVGDDENSESNDEDWITYLVDRNAQGDVLELIPEEGNDDGVIYMYRPQGTFSRIPDSSSNSDISVNPLRYRGYYYDTDLEMYYLTSRYYDPVVGRFINGDAYLSTGQGIIGYNMFAYCNNNTVNRVDPTGTCFYNASGQWCHDNWEFLGGYQRLPDPGYYQGTTESGKDVYIAPNTNYSTPPNSVKVVDYRDTNINPNTGEHDPSIQIRDSYKISDLSEQNQILDIIDTYNTNNPSKYNWERSRSSLIKEWEIHNVVYLTRYAIDSTAHVDFNVDDEGKGYAAFLWERVVMS